MRNRALPLALSLFVAAGLAACSNDSSASPGQIQVLASFYPLAWVAQQVGGPNVHVEDLTPPGVEAHDTNLSAGQRADLETAKLVLILGHFGFQPQVESAASESSGKVISVTTGMELNPSSEQDLQYDPHVWLDPVLMEKIVQEVTDGLASVDPSHATGYRKRGAATASKVSALATSYETTLKGCAFDTFVTTHEAFGYLADQYGLHQLGLEGLTPEAEPSAARIQAATQAIQDGKAAPAVFYEDTNDGKRIGESVAGDVGAPAHPLGTLESEPSQGDYLSIMQANLQQLKVGLRCP
jgi:zinc transport system substrate-binding protein